MIGRLRTVLVALVLVGGAAVAVPVQADASATKCTENICMHVSGKGLHISFVQMSSRLGSRASVTVQFDIEVSNGDPYTNPFYRYSTRTYHWSNTTKYPINVPPRTFYTSKYVNNRTLPEDGYQACVYFDGRSGPDRLCAAIRR